MADLPVPDYLPPSGTPRHRRRLGHISHCCRYLRALRRTNLPLNVWFKAYGGGTMIDNRTQVFDVAMKNGAHHRGLPRPPGHDGRGPPIEIDSGAAIASDTMRRATVAS